MHTILEPIGEVDPTTWRGVAVVIHGLNLQPERLRPLVDEVRRWGIGAVFCSLQGHGENYQPLAEQPAAAARLAAFRQVSYAGWRGEILAAYQTAATLAAEYEAPIFLLAFSLGALLGCELLVTEPTMRFDRMALLAPAAMIFVPSIDGRSHAPEEFTQPEDLALGVQVLAEAVIALDQQL